MYVIWNITLKAILKIPLYNHFMYQLLKSTPKPTDDVIREWQFHALSSSFKMVASLIAAFVWLWICAQQNRVYQCQIELEIVDAI